jgi:hypothetical protein
VRHESGIPGRAALRTVPDWRVRPEALRPASNDLDRVLTNRAGTSIIARTTWVVWVVPLHVTGRQSDGANPLGDQ